MNATSGGAPDWWSLFTRMPFMGRRRAWVARHDYWRRPTDAGSIPLQQFLAACQRHIALMRGTATELGKGANETGGSAGRAAGCTAAHDGIG